MKTQVQNQIEIRQSVRPFYSIIPLIDESNSKGSQQNSLYKVSKLRDSSRDETNSLNQKNNSDSPSPKKYNFNNNIPKLNKEVIINQKESVSNQNSKDDRKYVLQKIIFATKSSNYLPGQISKENDQEFISKKIGTNDKNEKIKKSSSDFPTPKNSKNDENQKLEKIDENLKCRMPKSISESKIREKEAQKDTKKIVFVIESPINYLPKPTTPNPNKKEQNSQVSNEDETNLRKSSSDFPRKDKFNNNSSDQKEIISLEKESNAKVTRKGIQATKSSILIQKNNQIAKASNQNETEATEIEKLGQIIKANSDFPSPEKIKSDNLRKFSKNELKSQYDLVSNDQTKSINLKNKEKAKLTTKSSNIIQSENEIIQKSSQPRNDKIKKVNSDFITQRKSIIDSTISQEPSKTKNKENLNKIPRKPIAATKSSNCLPKKIGPNENQKQNQSNSKPERIEKSNSSFQTAQKLEDKTKENRENIRKENISKVPKTDSTALKSSNILQKENKQSQNQQLSSNKSNKIKKYNSSFQTKPKLEEESKLIKDDTKLRRPPATAMSSSNIPRQDQNNQRNDLQQKSSQIKISNLSFSAQQKLEEEVKASKKTQSTRKSAISAKPLRSQQENNEDQSIEKSDKIKKSNSSLTSDEKSKMKHSQMQEKVNNNNMNISNINSSQKEISIEIEIQQENQTSDDNGKKDPNRKSGKLKNEVANKDSPKEIQGKGQNNEILARKCASKDSVQEFTPHFKDHFNISENSTRNNSPIQSSSNLKQMNSETLTNTINNNKNNNILFSNDVGNANKNVHYSAKNKANHKSIQIEIKNSNNSKTNINQINNNNSNRSNTQNNNNQKKSSNSISVQQNQKQKLNIIIKSKDSVQRKETEKTNESKPASKEQSVVTKDQSSAAQPQPKENTKHHKEAKQSSRIKENRFVWKEPSKPKEAAATTATAKDPVQSSALQSSSSPTTTAARTIATIQPPTSVGVPLTKEVAKNESKEDIIFKDQAQLSESLEKSKEYIPLNEISRLNEEMKKQIKYEIEMAQQLLNQNSNLNANNSSSSNNNGKQKNIFTLKLAIESQPICIAIGDIEGDVEKLQQICEFIKTNPSLSFVFIGDIIDDLSDACSSSEQSWECLSILSEFFLTSGTFTLDSQDDAKSGTVISLPSSFCDISFKKVKYGCIQKRVKFLAGNAECDNLLDFQKPCQIIPGDVTRYVFGQGRWKKTVTFNKMCLLYRYLKSCYGIIAMKKAAPEGKKNVADFVDTVYFRHSPSSFKINRFPKNMYSPNPDLKKSDVDKKNFFFVTGHARIFASIASQAHDNKEMFYVVDTTVLDAQKQYLKDVGGYGTNDRRLAVISFDKNVGFSVKAFSLPCQFPKSTLKCTISDKYVQIKGI